MPSAEDRVDLLNEFAHDGRDDQHLGFAGRAEACPKRAQGGVVTERRERGKVQGFAEPARPEFGERPAAPH